MTNKNKILYDLFPPIDPYETGYMTVEEPHTLYWEQCGNPEGVPIVFVHGGPGSGCKPFQRQYFDPAYYRIILFDQRGAGRSTPHACLEKNTPHALVQDMEQLRKHLNIEKWHVFGGSWGSTLSLAYAAEHAEHCLSLILRGIFLMEDEDLDWLYNKNKNIWPDRWEEFTSILSDAEKKDVIGSYYKRLTSEDKIIREEAAVTWSLYETSCIQLIPDYEAITTAEQKKWALAFSRIECHYFHTQKFSAQNSLLNKVDKFRHVPAYIIHGRYDCVCPVASAYRLHQAWPEAEFIIVPDGGHSAMDPPIRSHLIEAAEKIKNRH